ncbi:cation ABC transporter substrate-binding protein [Malaciobacter molluscorum LMG 25693]|uniref:Cation ABC transporter substrate-binding protein n=1 Tax=Malaciobacter molluscorum LMG 25693 TaxID=870501 RepID=A0A2G1DJD7_9BACT|nr:zinc ABC transporter substrate-binding protein [Malaciobacter molluscorum]AXX91690.1 metal ion ABC transporter, periplasmic metal-binding protein [Malaciobacter molluscorum LMG 25693]PHO18514.1 cation ABC transporter substrate-binding protein [Malaciobacter molluscorum LMG 25693]
MKKLLMLFLAFSIVALAKEVTVSIVPQKYFVEKIAKNKISVNVMVRPGFEPATYEPKASQMRKLVSSSVYFSIGVPFEKVWLEKFKNANKNLLIVDTSKSIDKLPMAAHHHHDEHQHHEDEEHESHEHHEHESHEHGSLDPHIWLDPLLVKIQAKSIYETLVKIDSQNKEFYKTNYEEFIKEIDSLYMQIKNILKPVKGKTFMVFHPAWGYFAKRFDLKQMPIEIEGKEPKPSQLANLIEEAKEHNIKVVFVAPEFSQKSAKVIAKSIDGVAVAMSPLKANWSQNLIETAKQIVSSYNK